MDRRWHVNIKWSLLRGHLFIFGGVTSLQDQHAPACCAEYPVITPTFCAPGKKRRLVMVKWYTMTCSQVFVVHATEVVYLYYIQIDVHKRPSKKMAQFSFIGFGWLAMFIYWTHIRNYKTLGSMCKSPSTWPGVVEGLVVGNASRQSSKLQPRRFVEVEGSIGTFCMRRFFWYRKYWLVVEPTQSEKY